MKFRRGRLVHRLSEIVPEEIMVSSTAGLDALRKPLAQHLTSYGQVGTAQSSQSVLFCMRFI